MNETDKNKVKFDVVGLGSFSLSNDCNYMCGDSLGFEFKIGNERYGGVLHMDFQTLYLRC